MDKVYGRSSTNDDLFQEAKPLVQSVMAGLDACIFAYGASRSGKSRTMQGYRNDPGLIER